MREIPDVYKGMSVIGRGLTSLVLELNKTNVIVLTRDIHKKNWLCDSFGLGMGETIDEFYSNGHDNPQLKDFHISVIQMKKLQPISRRNKFLIRQDKDELIQLWREINRSELGSPDKCNEVLEFVEANHPFNRFIPFLIWGTNYDNWVIDIHMGNFAEDKGDIVVLDPVCDPKLIEVVYPDRPSYR